MNDILKKKTNRLFYIYLIYLKLKTYGFRRYGFYMVMPCVVQFCLRCARETMDLVLKVVNLTTANTFLKNN